MQNLCNIIPAEDKECMMQWINSYANCFPERIETVLRKWSENKKTLYRALGKKLRVSYPIKVEKDQKVFYRELTKIYKPLPSDILLEKIDNYYYYDIIEDNHPFIQDLYLFLQRKYKEASSDNSVRRQWEITKNLKGFSRLLSYSFIQSNRYNGFDIIFYNDDGDTKTIKSGARVIRAIQGVLKFLGYDKMENFNKWRNNLSDLNNARNIECNLVFSIHPLDFMTMSDNACNWRSCMAWQNSGSYSSGTIEMMNSNNTMVVYLESPKPFVWNDHVIPNKSWRCLFYVHKKIICLGKSYPYYNEKLNLEVLKIAMQFLKENLNWKYQYKYQQYKDLKPYYSNEYVRLDLQAHHQKSHNIYLYTYGMYADLVEDQESIYWCCRNWVKDDLKICVSGRATCMNCGEYLDEDLDDFSLTKSSRKYCYECEHSQCYTCKKVDSTTKHYNIRLYKTNMSFSYLRYILVPVCEECFNNDIYYDKANDFYVYINDKPIYEKKIEKSASMKKPEWMHAKDAIGSNKIV